MGKCPLPMPVRCWGAGNADGGWGLAGCGMVWQAGICIWAKILLEGRAGARARNVAKVQMDLRIAFTESMAPEAVFTNLQNRAESTTLEVYLAIAMPHATGAAAPKESS
jgi:hypothetical protein